MSERMLQTKICIVSKLCHIRMCVMPEPGYVTMMSHVRIYVANDNV